MDSHSSMYLLLQAGSTSQVSQQSIVVRVISHRPPAASGSQIWTIMTATPVRLSQYSLTDLGDVSFNLSGGATSQSVTPTTLLEDNQ